MEGLDEKAVGGMIEIARRIAQDYECGFGRTGDEKGCGEWDLSAKLITLPKEYN